MKSDTERYKLCLQCVSEAVSFPYEKNYILFTIRNGIELEKIWENPIYVYSNWKLYALCRRCPYKLEHAVLAQREIDEQ